MTPPETPTPEIPKERIEEALLWRNRLNDAPGLTLQDWEQGFVLKSNAEQIESLARHLHSLHQQIAEAERSMLIRCIGSIDVVQNQYVAMIDGKPNPNRNDAANDICEECGDALLKLSKP
jgi:hypothetical protein